MSLSTQLVWLFVLGGAGRVRGLDGHARGHLRRRAPVLRRAQPPRPIVARTEVLLPLHLRVLLQPLHRRSAGVLLIDLRLLVPGWRGTAARVVATVWVANVYMSLFARLRLDIKRERVEITQEEHVAARLADDEDERERPARQDAHSLTRTEGPETAPRRRIIRPAWWSCVTRLLRLSGARARPRTGSSARRPSPHASSWCSPSCSPPPARSPTPGPTTTATAIWTCSSASGRTRPTGCIATTKARS